MALGADRGHVLALILKGDFALIVIGLVIGLSLTYAAGRHLGKASPMARTPTIHS